MMQNRDLSQIRADIDAVDDQIVQLFVERMRLAKDVAHSKMASGAQLAHTDREQAILLRVCSAAGDYAPYAKRLFETLFALSKEYQAHVMQKDGSGI